jgi:hypothetical protein
MSSLLSQPVAHFSALLSSHKSSALRARTRPIFGVKLNLHFYKTVKDFKTYSLTNIAAANVCIMKKIRGLYRVSETRNFNFSPGPFLEIVAILTAPAVQ